MAEPPGNGVRLALTTGPDEATVAELARRLVEEGLVACVNLIPRVRSVYRWEGEVHDESEVLAILKTTTSGVAALERRIHELHPYDVPEFLVLSADGSRSYLSWVRSCVSTPAQRKIDG